MFSFGQLRFATGLDIAMMIIGTIAAMAVGAGLPCMIIVFGDMTDSFVGNAKTSQLFNMINFTQFNTTKEIVMKNPAMLG